MSYESEDEAALPERVMASLRDDPQPPAGLEEKTIARLRAADELTAHPRSRHWRWVPQTIAAAMLFGAGVAFGNWHALGRSDVIVMTGTPAHQMQLAGSAYVWALNTITPSDSIAAAVATDAFRVATAQIVHLFPENQLGFVVDMALGGIADPSSGNKGREERVIWF